MPAPPRTPPRDPSGIPGLLVAAASGALAAWLASPWAIAGAALTAVGAVSWWQRRHRRRVCRPQDRSAARHAPPGH